MINMLAILESNNAIDFDKAVSTSNIATRQERPVIQKSFKGFQSCLPMLYLDCRYYFSNLKSIPPASYI